MAYAKLEYFVNTRKKLNYAVDRNLDETGGGFYRSIMFSKINQKMDKYHHSSIIYTKQIKIISNINR